MSDCFEEITIQISKKLYNDMKKVEGFTKRDTKVILEKSLERILSQYRDRKTGEINPRNAFLLPSIYEKRVAENEGKSIPSYKRPCVVLSETTIMGDPYYVIFCTDNPVNGNIVSVPKDQIEFAKEG